MRQNTSCFLADVTNITQCLDAQNVLLWMLQIFIYLLLSVINLGGKYLDYTQSPTMLSSKFLLDWGHPNLVTLGVTDLAKLQGRKKNSEYIRVVYIVLW